MEKKEYSEDIIMLGRGVLREAPILFGLALVEHQYHDTARIEAVRPEDIESREAELLAEAAALLPKLPFDKADLLVVDQIGKNISGVGMDPNVIGRHAHHYSTLLQNVLEVTPFIRRIYVRGLTPETHGNAIGVGLADAVHLRLAEAMDAESTFVNVRTALTLHNAKLPMHFPNDRAAIAGLLDTLALSDPALARVMRIRNTLDLATLELSEAFAGEAAAHENLTVLSKSAEWQFDTSGDLDAMA